MVLLLRRLILACALAGLLGGVVSGALPGAPPAVHDCHDHDHDPCEDPACPDPHGDEDPTGSRGRHHHHCPGCVHHHAAPQVFFETPQVQGFCGPSVSWLAVVIEHEEAPDPPFLAEDEPPLV